MNIRTPLMNTTALVLTCSVIFFGCNGEGSSDVDGTNDKDTIQEAADPDKGNIMNVDGKLFSIPSPVQTTLLIRKLGVDMVPDITNPADNASRYTTKAKRALNLGVYGADMGYMTVFNNSQSALNYLKAIEGLADQLDISNAFDQDLVKRFSNSMGDEDSLLVITGEAFRASDEYLKSNERNEVAAMILAGGWVESLYFSVNGAAQQQDAALMDRIAEQRTPLKNLISLLTAVDQEGECKELISQLNDLKSAFDEVELIYHYEKPSVMVEEKTTFINCHTEVVISAEQLDGITNKLTELRNSIIA